MMTNYNSFSKIIIRNSIMTIPYLILSIVFGFFSPFIPTQYVPSEKPASLNNYLITILKTDLAFVSFILIIVVLISLFEFLKLKTKNKKFT